ncbi:UPF0759 protein YunF [Robertmurraya siralis]|uniref:UPF0759 protein YunF n=1 Tax=Robertmurraya siralis TaxID=77777 RepID=A0A920BTZ4_9BACI|nr:DUF72 domain-containing protein [Robertmurraya siralis]GIN62091.1 UPF0759 protein YunF [Robertmurraya siralis]
MIYVGLTGWGDHDSLYELEASKKNKLAIYASYFPTVEVDSSFYAVQPLKNAQKWVEETPASFQFIVKAYQGMTGHQRGEIPFDSKKEMFQAFKDSLTPYIEAGKLAMVLFQFPPWFDCKKENVQYLRWCRQEMGDIPSALEFRHQSWFWPAYYERTLQFMEQEQWIHSICDEPQAGEGSIPIVLKTTRKDKVLVRFHGRNIHGWQKRTDVNWREVRYLYRYNEEELREWVNRLKMLQNECRNVYVVFNNNSGGDAADNGKELIELMKIEYENLAPRQLDLF